MKKKLSKKKILFFVPFLVLIVITCTLFSKYTSVFHDTIPISVRNPEYKVVFHANGGSGVMNDQTFVYGVEEAINSNEFTNSDLNFTGWNTEADGSGSSFNDNEILTTLSNVDGDVIDLYAQWNQNNVVTFDANGGVIPSSESWNGSGNSVTKSMSGDTYGDLPIPTKEGKQFMGWSYLPNEYQEVEYIESDGKAYFDLGVIPDDATGVYTKMATLDLQTTSMIIGSNGTRNSKYFIGDRQGKAYYGWNNDLSSASWIPINEGQVYIAELNFLNSRKYKFGDNTLNITSTLATNNRSLYVFAGHWNNSPGYSYMGTYKLYELKISEGEEIIHDYKPCYRKIDYMTGLYDVVDGVFVPYTASASNSEVIAHDIKFISSTDKYIKNDSHVLHAVWGNTLTFSAEGGTLSYSEKGVFKGQMYGELPTATKDHNAFLGWTSFQDSGRLPEGFKEVEYIESDGSSYIDTGVLPKDSIGVRGKVLFNDVSADTVIFGSKATGDTRFLIGHNVNKNYYGWNTILDSSLRPLLKNNTIYNFELNYLNSRKYRLLNSGLDVSSEFDIEEELSASNNRTLSIFAYHTSSNIYGYNDNARLYSLQITDGSDVIRDFVPCYRIYDSQPGLYDLVNNVFYENLGSGQFKAGIQHIESSFLVDSDEDFTLYADWKKNPIVTLDPKGGTLSNDTYEYRYDEMYGDLPVPVKVGYTFSGWLPTDTTEAIPDDYQVVEYIQSQGASYIDTGYIPNDETGVKIKAASLNTSSDTLIMGSKGSSDSRFYIADYAGKAYYGWNTNKSGNVDISVGNYVTYDMELNYLNSRTFKYNNAVDSINETLSSNNNKSIYIFAANWNGTAKYNGKYNIYSFEISQGDQVVRKFVPCYRKSTGTIGLYEIYDGKFYTNVDTTSLTKGEDINTVTPTTSLYKDTDHTLYAKWNKNVQVSFDTNGGTLDTLSKTVSTGLAYGELPTPHKDGYMFFGWTDKPLTTTQGLPSDYQEVDSIKFDGLQYINTNYNLWNGTNWKIDAKFDYYGNGYVFGNLTSPSKAKYVQVNSIKNLNVYFGSSFNVKPFYDNQTYDVSLDNSGSKFLIYVDSNLYSTNSKQSVTSNAISTIGYNYSGSGFKGNMYYTKMWDNDTLVRDYVPCYRISDGEIGLYDRVEDIFYNNNGLTKFSINNIEEDTIVKYDTDHTLYARWIKSPQVSFDTTGGSVDIQSKDYLINEPYGELPTPTKEGFNFMGWSNNTKALPSDYQKVDYIESSTTQYINLDVIPTDSTGFYIKAYDNDSSGTVTLLGEKGSTSSTYYGVNFTSDYLNYYWNSNFGTSFDRNIKESNKIFTIEFNYLNSRKIVYDNEVKHFITSTLNTTTRPIYLFGFNNNGSLTQRGKFRVYEFRISENDVVTHEYVPCYRKTDSVPGLYDLNIDTFLPASNSNVLLKGNDADYVTSSTIGTTLGNHTLYAIWEEISN